mgnify:CR=1 FL=1
MSQNPPLPQQSTSPHPQHKGFSFTRTFFALFGTAIVSVVFTACSDAELDENIEYELSEYDVPDVNDDIDAQIAEDIARQNAVLARGGSPALTPWERCLTAATYRHENVTDVCGTLPTSQQE